MPKFITWTTIIFILEIALAHVIYTHFNCYTTPLSCYATGEYWFIVSSGLYFIATNYLLLAYMFSKRLEKNNFWNQSGIILLTIAGVATFVLTLFKTDIGDPSTVTGFIHVIAAHIHFICVPFSAICLSVGTKSNSMKFFKYYNLLFGLFFLGSGLVLVFKESIGESVGNYDGLIQKILIHFILVWIIISAQFLSKNELVLITMKQN